MTVDVYRRPAPLGPRLPLWLKLVLLWAAMVLLFVLAWGLIPDELPNGRTGSLTTSIGILLFLIGLVATVAMAYLQLRLVNDGSIVARRLEYGGTAVGDPSDPVRPSDPEERRAQHLLRRGAITRRQYEEIIARRHFVHGEISRAQYEETVQTLEERTVDARRGARPPPGPA